jgi:glycoprotein endo-alpha-1,2-mannosidase
VLAVLRPCTPATVYFIPCARYQQYWEAAAASGAHAISITSWNEWGEGTQIEACQNWTDPDTGAVYQDYGAGGPWLYLNITRQEASRFIRRWHDQQAAAQLANHKAAGAESTTIDQQQEGLDGSDIEGRVEL